MTSFDPSSGMQRVLTFDETLSQMRREKEDSTKPMNPALVRTATNFYISPFNQRMYDNVYEDLKRDQIIQATNAKIQAAKKQFQADTGLPPDMMPPPPPQDPPPPNYRPPPGPPGSSSSRGNGGEEPGGEPPPAPSFFPGNGNWGDLPPEQRRGRLDVDGITAMSVDGRGPPPPPGAPSMAIPIPVVHTPQQMSREDELRLVAEMQRVSQQRDMAQRELQTAQNVANMLHREREKDPIRVVQRVFYREPAAPPQVQPTPTVTPEQVQAAMQQAMAGERRNLRELLVQRNQSMADIVNKAASKTEAAPPPKKSRSYPRPLTAPTAIGSQKRKRDTEDVDPELGPRIPPNPSAAIDEANQIAKRMARKRSGGTIDPELGPRIPANPSAAIYDANQIAKRMARKRPGGTIAAELAQRVPENPAIKNEKAADLGKKLAAELTRRMAEKQAREAKQIIRMDQFDNKRPRASIMDDIDDAIAEYTRRRPQPVPERVAQHLKRRPVIA